MGFFNKKKNNQPQSDTDIEKTQILELEDEILTQTGGGVNTNIACTPEEETNNNVACGQDKT
tara:strand:+ start:9196 stop:9381 length:186 start_codon:yes stop_codon:yes gene_type:complete